METAPRSTRREFNRHVAALAVGTAGAGVAPAGDAPAARPASAGEALAEIVRLRYGRHLSEEQLRRVRQAIAGNLRAADRLYQVALQNGDEPAFAFSAEVP
jgi:hypothetical protein